MVQPPPILEIPIVAEYATREDLFQLRKEIQEQRAAEEARRQTADQLETKLDRMRNKYLGIIGILLALALFFAGAWCQAVGIIG